MKVLNDQTLTREELATCTTGDEAQLTFVVEQVVEARGERYFKLRLKDGLDDDQELRLEWSSSGVSFISVE